MGVKSRNNSPTLRYSGGGKGSLHPVYITDITGSGPITLVRRPVPNEEEVIGITTNETTLLVTLEWDRNVDFEGLVTMQGIDVIPDYKFDGTYRATNVSVTIDPAKPQIVITQGGKTRILPVEISLTPVILSAVLSGIYPNTQTELKAGDIVTMDVVTDIPVVQVDFTGGLATGTLVTFTSATTFTVTIVVTNTSTTLAQLAQTFTVTSIEVSLPFTTTNTMAHDNTYPIVTIDSILYPNTQQALKGSEIATIESTVSGFDTITYTSPNSELTIDATDTRLATRVSGAYNVTIDNYQIQATRNANGAVTTASTVVFIADVAPLIGIASAPFQMRSGGSDTSIAPSYLIQMSATQLAIEPPTVELVANAGVYNSANFIANTGTTMYTRSIQVLDTHIKGVHPFGTFSFLSLSRQLVTTITGSSTYEIRGFVVRNMPLPPFNWQVGINVLITDPDKVRVHWRYQNKNLVRSMTNTRPQYESFFIDGVGTNTPTIWLLEQSATDSSSQESIVEIQEVI